MPRYTPDGNTLIYWVLSIANTAAPTVAELNAGTRVSTYLTRDEGLEIDWDQKMVEGSSIEETFDAMDPGTEGVSLKATWFRNSTADTLFTTVFATRNTAGYWVVRPGVAVDTAWTAGQKAEVYPANMHRAVPVKRTTNTKDKASAAGGITSSPSLNATVAA